MEWLKKLFGKDQPVVVVVAPQEEPVVSPPEPEAAPLATPAAPTGLSVCPDHTASICHLLIHDPIGLSWDQMFPEDAAKLRQMLIAGTMPDLYLNQINDRFKHVAKGLWGKETTIDDIKYAFSKLAYTSEVK